MKWKSAVHMYAPPLPPRLRYNPSPPFPPFLPQTARILLPLQVNPAGGCLLRKATVEELYLLAVLCFLSELRGGLRHFQLLGFTPGRGECFVSSCLPLSLSLCCFTPAAARHQARLFQLTLNCTNNGRFCTFTSFNTFQTVIWTGY